MILGDEARSFILKSVAASTLPSVSGGGTSDQSTRIVRGIGVLEAGESASGRVAFRMPTKRLAIISRGDSHHPPEVEAEGGTSAETAILRDPLHRYV